MQAKHGFNCLCTERWQRTKVEQMEVFRPQSSKIINQHKYGARCQGGPANSIAASQFKSPWFNPEKG